MSLLLEQEFPFLLLLSFILFLGHYALLDELQQYRAHLEELFVHDVNTSHL